MNKINAFKMDGLGNDFIIFDGRKENIILSKKNIKKISNRNNIGCDQVILVKKNKKKLFLKFFNSDGNEIAACGNGTRCVAYLLMKVYNCKKIKLNTKDRTLQAKIIKKNIVSVNMGKPSFGWKNIPLSKKMDSRNLMFKIKNSHKNYLLNGYTLNVGNPHVIFFVNNLKKYNLKYIGPKIENHNYFPKKCNVTLANIENKNLIKIKVWERGVGITKACGTAACATAVAAFKSKLTYRKLNIKFSKGLLNIYFNKNNNIYMTGKVSKIKKIIVKL